MLHIINYSDVWWTMIGTGFWRTIYISGTSIHWYTRRDTLTEEAWIFFLERCVHIYDILRKPYQVGVGFINISWWALLNYWQRRKNANASAAQTNAERLSKIIGWQCESLSPITSAEEEGKICVAAGHTMHACFIVDGDTSELRVVGVN